MHYYWGGFIEIKLMFSRQILSRGSVDMKAPAASGVEFLGGLQEVRPTRTLTWALGPGGVEEARVPTLLLILPSFHVLVSQQMESVPALSPTPRLATQSRDLHRAPSDLLLTFSTIRETSHVAKVFSSQGAILPSYNLVANLGEIFTGLGHVSSSLLLQGRQIVSLNSPLNHDFKTFYRNNFKIFIKV